MNQSHILHPDQLLAAIIDSSEDAIISKNLQSIITSWNAAAERMFGYAADEMIGVSIDRLFPVDRLQEENEILSRIQRGERVHHFETVRVRKNGTRIDVSLTISPIRDDNGKVVGASKIARDITEQKRSMRLLTEAHDELKRVDRMKAEFLATLSHELRTPLTAILGWIDILNDSPEDEDLNQGLKVIERNVRMQAQLIEDLLDMSRIESGKITLDMQRVDLASVAVAAMETVHSAAHAKEIQLTPTFGSINGLVLGDKNRLQQVIWNLLSNAVKFTPKNGRIRVVIAQVNSHVEISVADNGQGIAPEFIEQVFDRFRQADASTTRRHGGLGLGLAIAKNIVELHGGTISVASAGLGQGATFTIGLPLLSAQFSAASDAADKRNAALDKDTKEGDLRGVKVLVADDEPDSGDIIRRILERHGADVRVANSMNVALAHFGEFHPHLVLSDIGMPEHDGFELIKRLRLLPEARSVPVIALTALARSEDRARVLRAGFQMHVAKPVNSDELVAIIQNLVALRS